MPTGLTPIRRLEHIVFFPIRFRTERLPRGRVKCWPLNAPAAVWQVLEIELAVVKVHRRLQRTDAVEALHELIAAGTGKDRKSTRLNSSHSQISYAVFCLKKKKKKKKKKRKINTTK